MEWQPIETAPKDKPIWIFGEDFFAAVKWDYEDWCVYSAYNEPIAFIPTHWALPEPPNKPIANPEKEE